MDLSVVDNLSATTEVRRDQLFRWFADQGDILRYEVARLQTDLAMRNRHKYDKKHRTEFYYAMLARAVMKLHWIETAQSKKTALSSEKAGELTARRIQRIKQAHKWRKSSPKKEIIRSRFYELIRLLRSEDMSWRQVVLYIEKYHRMTFSLAYLKSTYEDLERERAEVEGET